MKKAIFIDRDGTINVDYGYVHKIEDFRLLPRVLDGLKIFKKLGFLIIIVTNQSGIGRGYYKLSDYRRFMRYMTDVLEKNEIRIAATYVCPHHPDEKCSCRKPKTKNYKNAIKKFNINVSFSYAIGDKTEDIKSGKNIGVKTILVKTGKGGLDKKYKIKPDYIAKDLYQASLIIQKNEKIN